MNPPEAADWKLLVDLLAERFGLLFSGTRLEILEARLRPRFEALHFSECREYYHFLRFHPEREVEFAELAGRLTNNETYFFRETAQFDAIVSRVIPELVPLGSRRPVRILSAACSSGEEPYSLAVRLTDAGLELAGVSWQIDACDLNPARIEQARRATYQGMSLRACSPEDLEHCFTAVNGCHQLRDRYRKNVKFFQANLALPMTGIGWGEYDIALCRNMLIYFSPDAFDRVISRFAGLVRPGGYLFLGHSESLFDRTEAFEPVHMTGTLAYRRVAS